MSKNVKNFLFNESKSGKQTKARLFLYKYYVSAYYSAGNSGIAVTLAVFSCLSYITHCSLKTDYSLVKSKYPPVLTCLGCSCQEGKWRILKITSESKYIFYIYKTELKSILHPMATAPHSNTNK